MKYIKKVSNGFINIPDALLQAAKINHLDTIEFEFDEKNDQILIRRVDRDAQKQLGE